MDDFDNMTLEETDWLIGYEDLLDDDEEFLSDVRSEWEWDDITEGNV